MLVNIIPLIYNLLELCMDRDAKTSTPQREHCGVFENTPGRDATGQI